MTINVLSYGESLCHYKRDDNITIGVNYICEKQRCDYVLIVDCPNDEWFEKKGIFKHTPGMWLLYREKRDLIAKFVNHKIKNFQTFSLPEPLHETRSKLDTIEYEFMFELLPFSYCSPYICVCIAYRMGAKIINLYGIDFHTNTDAASPETNAAAIADFRLLYNYLTSRGVKMQVTPESKLTEFIPVIPGL